VEALLSGGENIHIGDTTIHVERMVSMTEAPLTPARRFGAAIGASPAMRRLFPLCEKLAASEIPILLEGETGTGKETVAEAIHEASARAKLPFVVFDCTSVSGGIMAELLCGHEQEGRHVKGAIEEADGGTLFVDEIGELDKHVQPRLLRLIERGEIQPVGTTRIVRVDVRVIVATARNLDLEVQAERFREDLLVRLMPGRIELPPLRDRTGDIGLLTRHFWRTLGGEGKPVPSGLVERFSDYPWPGNVSELIAAVTRVLAAGDVVLEAANRPSSSAPPQDASASIFDNVLASGLSLARGRDRVVAEFERRYVQRLLAEHNGNVSRAAAASGLARRYFQLLKARHLKGG
jgi:DNA-binding NtrC family response regulator